MSSPWNRMDQLLKCSVCSSRFRNPKLLPCNHTFCAEPCLSRCVDKTNKHQIKCPECSAEHRMPLQGGVQGFPHNVTLGRFLELREQVSGREPELPASMQKCNTCKEKGQLVLCAHCNRKVCKECKTAHVNILRKEIALINGQVREGLQQLSNALNCTKENEEKLQKNYSQVKDEIEEVVRRYTRDLLDTESKLKHHLDIYLKSELRSMRRLEHDLEVELNNVNSNCDLVDKYVNNGVDWTDAELTDYKEIFQKTLEFLRAFDTDPTDCVRKVKFHPRSDPDVIHKTLIDFAEVKLNEEPTPNSNPIDNQPLQNGGMYSSSNNLNQGPSVTLTPPKTNALSRSQSDHKLCGQRQSQKRKDLDENENALSRRFRDKFVREDRDSSERDIPNNRDHSPSSWRRELEEVRHPQKNRFSSREVIDENDDSDAPSRSRSAMEGQAYTDHVNETEDATKGPLSGVIRILDSPHVMERLHHSEVKQKRMKEEEERKARMPPPAPPPVSRPMTRQLSEDEIEKQKKENKAAAAAAASSSTNTTAKSGAGTESSRSTKSVPKREEDRTPYTSRYTSSRTPSEETNSPKTRTSPRDEPSLSSSSGRRTSREEPQTTTPPPSRLRSWRTTSSAATERDASQSPPSSPTRGRDKPPPSPRTPPASNRPTSRFLPKPSSLDKDDPPADAITSRRSNLSTTVGSRSSPIDKRDDRPKLRLSIPHHSPSSSDTSSSSESESEDIDSETAVKRGDISPSVNTLLARSAQARKQSANTQARILNQPEDKLPRPSNRPWRESLRKDEEPPRESLTSSRRKTSIVEPEERSTPYSRLFDRRRSSVTSGNSRVRDLSPEDNSYSARRSRIARSKSSHDLCPAEDSPEDDTLTAIRNRYRTRRALRDKSPESTVPHSWSEYMKNKYGTGGRPTVTNTGIIRSRTSASLVAPRSDSDNSSDEDTPPRRKTDYSRRGDSNSPRGFSLPRRTYMQKGKSCFKFGARGTEHGCFTWPRGVSVGTDNTIVVADSNNHRVQVFSASGKYIQEFGAYGSGDGEFDCLAGVTVNRIGQFIVSDRYNHRLQVFDPNGRFIRAFGHEGRTDGKFNYPWGVATDNLGFIYVCDKENHRIQVFQGDGTYVTKFGGIGQRPGELEHPHYVAVSTTNRVIVSDSNNHRIQIYDVNGRLLSTFGTEGSEEGQFKYPRGVAVDDQGYLIVGDSGNNRIQIFHPDGTFLKAFGTWGSGDGEFKGLEGIAVSPTGQILACDRENHRIQVF